MLSLLGSIYGKLADARTRLYDRGVFEAHDLGARTVSIGNITTGGTGKTPLVAYVAGVLAERGEKVCILTRGYGRENPKQRVLVSDGATMLTGVREAGDEPFELANKLLGKSIVIADANRVSAAEWAKRKFGVTAFVLDDGFQHRRAKRDVDIVCVDATDPFGGGKMLPAGRLREPLHNLNRADIVVITRANLAEDISDLKFQISNLSPESSIFCASNRIPAIIGIEEFHAKPQRTQSQEKGTGGSWGKVGIEFTGRPVFAFCGIGNPANFVRQLEQENLDVAGFKAFPDHHIYKQEHIAQVEEIARQNGAISLLTTAKDAVKLGALKFTLPCYVVEIEVLIENPTDFGSMF